jgi:PPOX class probable F420-dependent enzyme
MAAVACDGGRVHLDLPRSDPVPLDADAARLAKAPTLATVVTLMPNGQPQAQLTWIDTDGENILINTEPQRQRGHNIRRDPRVTVLLHSAENPYDWAETRGHVIATTDGQPARDHIDQLSHRYTGNDYGMPIGPQGRVIYTVQPDKVNTPKTLGR